jgi:hypothetical protein
MRCIDWVKDRGSEPSSYVAVGLVVMGPGVLFDQPIVVAVGIIGGILGFILKEKGMI